MYNSSIYSDTYTDRLFRIKKICNVVICFLIFLLGITSFIYKANYEGGIITCFREMTVDGTIFASLSALLYGCLSVYELKKNFQFKSSWLYYLRLSSTVTEFIILITVLIGLLPFIYQSPTILRYDMMNMHVIIPVLSLCSFIFNDAPIGKLKPLQIMNGLIFLTLYTIGQLICILGYLYPEEDIPYFFLNVRNQSIWFTLFALVFFFALGYFLSWLFYVLNRKGTQIRYKTTK